MLDSANSIVQTAREMQITIYTDGACDIHAENRPGGWAAILRAVDDDGALLKETALSGGEENTTNNRMELTAVIQALKTLGRPARVKVVTDSRYVLDIAAGKKKAKHNIGLWQDFQAAAEAHEIAWQYVAGHSGDALNERCDRMAVAEKLKLARDQANYDGDAATPIPEAAYKIYLSTRYSGKLKAAAWSAVVRHGEASSELSGRLERTSELEAVLIGAIEALKSLPVSEPKTVFTAQEYLSKGMNDWMAGWIKRNWKAKGGAAVKHKAHWLALHELAQSHAAHFAFVKHRAECPYFERGAALAAECLARA